MRCETKPGGIIWIQFPMPRLKYTFVNYSNNFYIQQGIGKYMHIYVYICSYTYRYMCIYIYTHTDMKLIFI